jgi:hypothetical protein
MAIVARAERAARLARKIFMGVLQLNPPTPLIPKVEMNRV